MPASILARQLYDRGGWRWDDAVLDHPRHLPATDDMPPLPWLESSTSRPEPPKPLWTRRRPTEIRLMEWAARRAMDAGGYERARLDVEPGKLAVIWERLRDLPESIRAVWLFLRLGLRSRDPRLVGSPASRAILRRLNPAAWERYPGFEIPQAPALLGPADRPAG